VNVKTAHEAEAKFRVCGVLTFLCFLGASVAAKAGAGLWQLCLIVVTVVCWSISFRFLSIRDKLDRRDDEGHQG